MRPPSIITAPSLWTSSTQSSSPSAATPCTAKIWLEGVGVALNPKNGKLLHNELEGSGVDNIYAIYAIVTTGCVYVCTTVREDNWKQL